MPRPLVFAEVDVLVGDTPPTAGLGPGFVITTLSWCGSASLQADQTTTITCGNAITGRYVAIQARALRLSFALKVASHLSKRMLESLHCCRR